MVSCLMGDSTALASAIVRCCLKFLSCKVYIQPQEHFTRNIIITSIAQYSTKYCAHSTFCVMKGGGCAMTKNTLIKVLGLAATVIGAGMSLVTDWVNEQKMEEKIEEKVNEALAKTDEEES